MKDDFSDYLYSNKISRFEWKLLQDQYSDEALNLLAVFSDNTFEKVMKSVKYIEYRTSKTLTITKFDNTKKTTLGILVPENSKFDFLNFSTFKSDTSFEINAFKSFKTIEAYSIKSEIEKFNLIESGYKAVDADSYNKLKYNRLKHLN